MAIGKAAGIAIEIDQDSLKRLTKALKVLGEADAPYLREAVSESGQRFATAVRSHAPGSMGGQVVERGVSGSGTGLRYKGVVTHPGARSREFGRGWYYRAYTGRKMKSGTKFKSAGQQAVPFLGVMKGDAATGEVRPYVVERMLRGIRQTWEGM